MERAADQLAASEVGLEQVAPAEGTAEERGIRVPAGVEPYIDELTVLKLHAARSRLREVDVGEPAPHVAAFVHLLAVPVLAGE